MARYVARRARRRARDHARTLDRRAALDGADYVINMVQIGGHEATLRRLRDPGALRAAADDRRHARDRRHLPHAAHRRPHARARAARWPSSARDAWLLNYTNPMAMLCWLVYAGTPTQNVVGLCHSVQFTTARPRGARRRARGRGHVPLGRAQPPGVPPPLRARRRGASTRGSTRGSRPTRSCSGACASQLYRRLRLLPDRVERARGRVRAVVHAPRRRARALPDPGRRVHPPQRGEPRRVRARARSALARGEAMPLDALERVRRRDRPLDGDRASRA